MSSFISEHSVYLGGVVIGLLLMYACRRRLSAFQMVLSASLVLLWLPILGCVVDFLIHAFFFICLVAMLCDIFLVGWGPKRKGRGRGATAPRKPGCI